jgi:hypothetical protein
MISWTTALPRPGWLTRERGVDEVKPVTNGGGEGSGDAPDGLAEPAELAEDELEEEAQPERRHGQAADSESRIRRSGHRPRDTAARIPSGTESPM